jgi:hypothetical protein
MGFILFLGLIMLFLAAGAILKWGKAQAEAKAKASDSQ